MAEKIKQLEHHPGQRPGCEPVWRSVERSACPGLSSPSATAADGTACCWLESRPTRHCDGQRHGPDHNAGCKQSTAFTSSSRACCPCFPRLAAVALVEPDYKVKVFWDATNPPDDPNFSQEVRKGLGFEWQVDRGRGRAGGGAERGARGKAAVPQSGSSTVEQACELVTQLVAGGHP